MAGLVPTIRGAVLFPPRAPAGRQGGCDTKATLTTRNLSKRFPNGCHVPWFFRGILMTLIAGLAVINASGTFSQLTAAHVGSRAISAAASAMEGTELDARIEVAAVKVADVDRRISAIDSIVAGAAQRGRANTAASIMADQRKARAALVAERQQAAQALTDLKVERGSVQARATIAESEAMPLRYAAEVLGMGGDDERVIRWLIALIVLCCDPLAFALTAAASARRSCEALSLSPNTQCRLPTQVAALNTGGNPRATIQTGDTLSRLNPVPREVLHARRLSHRFSRRLIPAGIRIACETLAHF
jgi:hypothetical protein